MIWGEEEKRAGKRERREGRVGGWGRKKRERAREGGKEERAMEGESAV